MRILLHSCCAPCTTFPLAFLRAGGHSVDGIFANPNLYPSHEAEKRWNVYRIWGQSVGLRTRHVEIPHSTWLSKVSGVGFKKPHRCKVCYQLRLDVVASIAKEEGYDCFTSSLLVSPYQDHDGIKEALESASNASGIPYLYQDFRPGYRRSREMARGAHLYMQKYCGCEFSLGDDE